MSWERNRLIELLEGADDAQKERKPADMQEFYSNVADYLLHNNVFVSPCKIGDIVYWIESSASDEPHIGRGMVSGVLVCMFGSGIVIDKNVISMDDIDKTVFLTRDKAMERLTEGVNNGQ